MAESGTEHPSLRRTIYFTGRVQGVGFRYTTEAVARDHDVTGFVRNLPDRRVELVAEGVESELDRFQQAVERHMYRNIDEIEVHESEPTGEFKSFGIAF